MPKRIERREGETVSTEIIFSTARELSDRIHNKDLSAREVMEAHLRLVPAPQVELSQLGYDTALHGAIALALSK